MDQIYSTSDYSLFKLYANNRPISRKHVLNIASEPSYAIKQRFSPIVVDKEHFVLDGQHRLEACKLLEIPVHYLIDETAEKKHVIDRNVHQQRWGMLDYVNFYAAHNSDFKNLLAIAKQFKMRVNFFFPVVSLFCGYDKEKRGISELVKKGMIKITPAQKLQIEHFLCQLMPVLKESLKIRKDYSKYLFTEKYMWAFSRLYLEDKILFEKVLTRIPITAFKFPYCRNDLEALEYLTYITKERKKSMSKEVDYD